MLQNSFNVKIVSQVSEQYKTPQKSKDGFTNGLVPEL